MYDVTIVVRHVTDNTIEVIFEDFTSTYTCMATTYGGVTTILHNDTPLKDETILLVVKDFLAA